MRHRHAVSTVEGGWRAQNYEQDWSTFFDGRGFEVTPKHASWRWGLRLTSYGYKGEPRRVSRARVFTDVEKISYQWDQYVREWIQNGDRLEHGYTVAARPGHGKELQFHLEIRGGLEPRIAPGGGSVAFVQPENSEALVNYGGLRVTDALGRELGARFVREDQGLRIEIEDENALYPVTVDPFAQQTYLQASNPDRSDQFGYSVAMDGDLAVVGAPFERGNGSSEADNSLINAGAAYVFVNSPSGWMQAIYLKAANPGPAVGDFFGWSVAISGRTIVVGASGKTANVAGQTRLQAGAAYVFEIVLCVVPGGAWCVPKTAVQQAYLQAFTGSGLINPRPVARFGWSVAISGDTVVVGAPNDDDAQGTQGIGSANIFTRVGTDWTPQLYLVSTITWALPYNFGQSVAISGDTMMIGEPNQVLGVNPGLAHVYTRTGGVWTMQATLRASNPDYGDGFGFSVAIDGDTAVVGAPREAGNGTSPSDNSTPNSGAAYLFTRSLGQWSAPAYLKSSNPIFAQQFGYSVAMSGDTTVVGAPAGSSTYLFRPGVYPQMIKASTYQGYSDGFGMSVAASGNNILAGGNGDVYGPANSGAAYVFSNAALASIVISAAYTSILKGATDQFTATGTYSDGTTADLTYQVTWNSSNAAVTINSAGVAYGFAFGSSNITASLNGIQSNAVLITVSPPALTSIVISAPFTSLQWGQGEQFTATGKYADNSTANLTSQVTWSSSNPAAVAISAAGFATTVANGSSDISATMSGVTSNTITLTLLCAANVTQYMSVTPDVFKWDVTKNLFTQRVTVTNIGPSDYDGSIALVLENLSPNAALNNMNGRTACNLPGGSPFIDLNPSGKFLRQQTLTYQLWFTNSDLRNRITYKAGVLTGPNTR
ncbi:MAG: Ig-like domain-containing protein [Bryobacterales bacterium]|nr:Ig-like domain-containing protein [Bryobacterales bacterium]